MKKALVCGAGGFIGSHMVTKLKHDGFWVRGAGFVFSGENDANIMHNSAMINMNGKIS